MKKLTDLEQEDLERIIFVDLMHTDTTRPKSIKKNTSPDQQPSASSS